MLQQLEINSDLIEQGLAIGTSTAVAAANLVVRTSQALSTLTA
jgi:hypothetical protein